MSSQSFTRSHVKTTASRIFLMSRTNPDLTVSVHPFTNHMTLYDCIEWLLVVWLTERRGAVARMLLRSSNSSVLLEHKHPPSNNSCCAVNCCNVAPSATLLGTTILGITKCVTRQAQRVRSQATLWRVWSYRRSAPYGTSSDGTHGRHLD